MTAIFDTVLTSFCEDVLNDRSLSETLLGLVRDFDASSVVPGFSPSSSRELAIYRQLHGFSKRFVGKTERLPLVTDEERQESAVALFVAANSQCEETNRKLRAWRAGDTEVLPRLIQLILPEAQSLIYDWFSDFYQTVPYGLVGACARPGPGSSIDIAGVRTDFYTKIADGPRTASTPFVAAWLSRIIASSPLWAETESLRSSQHGESRTGVRARFTTVPKSHVTDRGISVEPTDNMMLQLGTKEFLQFVLRRRLLIDLESQQEINRRLAYLGSTGRDPDNWATIDLKSASDTICVELVRYLIPPDIFEWLNAIRSDVVELPDGNLLPLEMMSTMGNGYTFPLQTLIFASLAHATLNMLGIRTRLQRSGRWAPAYAVYGDDIIVPARAYSDVTKVLEQSGFTVNLTKSFSEGLFRESCGEDWHSGYNVRPVMVESLDSIADRLSLINRLNVWSAQHSVGLPTTIAALLNSIPRRNRLPVPNFEEDDAGIKLPLEAALSCGGLGFSPQIVERHTVQGGCVINPGSIQYMVRAPRKIQLAFFTIQRVEGHRECKVIIPREDILNWPGALLSALHGSLKGHGICLRMQTARYKHTHSFTPMWGSGHVYGGLPGHWSGAYAHWEWAVHTNLSIFRTRYASQLTVS